MGHGKRISDILNNEKSASASNEHLDYYKIHSWNLEEERSWPVYPYAVEEAERSGEFWFRETFCGFMIVVILLKGNLLYACGEKKFRLQPGRVLIIPAGSTYSFESAEGNTYRKIVFELRGSHVQSLSESLGISSPMLLVMDTAPLLEDFRRLSGMIARRNEDEIPDMMAECYRIMNRLSLKARERKGTSRLFSMLQMHVESDLGAPFCIADLVRRTGISSATITRLFRKHLGISPQQYRIACRIEYAKELLVNTSLSVKETAFRTGYCNQFYFSQEFRRFTKASPLAYRRGMRAVMEADRKRSTD